MDGPLAGTPPTGRESDSISILHVDDDPDQTALTETALEREDDAFTVLTENDIEGALALLDEEEVDCVVSDYDMPEMNGLELLDAIRERDEDLPFILFTGKGSEEIASEAISSGVTDYLQKEPGLDQYTVLANRIKNAVSQYRAEREVEATSIWYQRILEHSSDYVMIVDGMNQVEYVSPAIERVMGYHPDDVIGTDAFDFVHPEDEAGAADALAETLVDTDTEVTVEFRAKHSDGSWRWLETRGRNFLDDPVIGGVMVNVRDITERKEREQAVKRQKERLQDLTGFLSHDLKNQLNVLDGYVELARDETGSDHLDTASRTIDRIDEMVTKFAELVTSQRRISDTEPVRLGAAVEASRENTTGREIAVTIESDATVQADEERLWSLLENLLLNAKHHCPEGVTVRVGVLPDRDGFYVEDDGPGIPPDDRDQVFDADYTTSETGSGLGLAIVSQIVDAHGWDIRVTDGVDGGARFEVTGVDVTD